MQLCPRPCSLALVLALGCTVSEDPADTDAPADTSGSGADPMLACALPEVQDTTDGMTNPLMETWGAACGGDADCVALLGDGAVCLLNAAGVYALPHGYCAKPCVLPDMTTRFVPDDPACDPAGGVACTGQKDVFEYCAPICTDDAQCTRDGYICRQMPLIAQPDDPSLCLMPDCCEDTCEE